MPIREIRLKSYKEQIFELFSEGAQAPCSSFQGWLEPPSPHVVGAYGGDASSSNITNLPVKLRLNETHNTIQNANHDGSRPYNIVYHLYGTAKDKVSNH